MTTTYVAIAPGTSSGNTAAPLLSLTVTGYAGTLNVPTLQDIVINNGNDVFTWTQLNESSKQQIATLATNSIDTNCVVEELSFFGNTSATAGSAAKLGVFGLSQAKTKTNFSLNFGTKTITGSGYITGLAPKISATEPVWVTPLKVTVTGDYTVT